MKAAHVEWDTDEEGMRVYIDAPGAIAESVAVTLFNAPTFAGPRIVLQAQWERPLRTKANGPKPTELHEVKVDIIQASLATDSAKAIYDNGVIAVHIPFGAGAVPKRLTVQVPASGASPQSPL